MATKRTRRKAQPPSKEPDDYAPIAALRQIASSLGYIALQLSPLKDKADTERIPFLNSLGFHRNEIASILSTTPGTVSKQLSIVKAAARGRKGAGKGDEVDGTDRPSTD